MIKDHQTIRPDTTRDLSPSRLPSHLLASVAVLVAFSVATNFAFKFTFTLSITLTLGGITVILALLNLNRDHQRQQKMVGLRHVLITTEVSRTKAQDTAAQKSRKLALMSHEIRTPLNGISGMLALLADTSLTAEQRNYVEMAQASARTQLSIIDEVLDMAKSESEINRSLVAVDLRAQIEKVTELLAPRAHAKGIEISAYVSARVPREIISDELHLRQILFNLAGNAIKFTERGGVAIEADWRGGQLFMRFRDTGIGMMPDEAARIFAEFAQANENTQSRFGGTGLGLAISKKIIENLNGSIDVQSAKGMGTTFETELPAAATGEDASSQDPLSGRHFALAMPEGFTRSHLAMTLEELGAEVSLAEQPHELLAEIAKARPLSQFICASQHFATLRKWSAQSKSAKAVVPPIWILLRPEERKQNLDLLRAPFAGYLLSPLRHSTLLQRLAAADGKALKQTGALMQKTKAKRKKKSICPALSILLAEDNAVNALLARTILQKLGHAVTLVGDGQSALKALATSRFDLAVLDVEMPLLSGLEVAHKLRSDEAYSAQRDLPLLALTANALDEDIRACKAAGMSDHLSKPFDTLDLEEKILALLKRPQVA